MPFYDFQCQEHKTTKEIFCTMSELPVEGSGDCPKCPECHKEMTRDYMSERGGAGCKKYSKPFVSDAMAMSPDQIPEHNRLFPDIKVEPDGRPSFDSYRQHDDYLKKTGFRKIAQKIKPKGRVIA